MSKKTIIWVMMLGMFSLSVYGEGCKDSISLISRIKERSNVYQLYSTKYTENPALHYLRYKTSLSDFYALLDVRNEKTSVLQHLGDGHTLVSLVASSYLKYKKNIQLWGKASYQKGIRHNVKWNSTSDIARIYPYFTADTLGGDMETETYFFSGGYAANYGWGQWGAEMNYRALHEFRAVDPRPRNIISDFTIKTGISYRLSSHYSVAMQLHTNIYKQDGNVDFYHELGGIPELLMTGLGSIFERFGANRTHIYYKGYAWGGDMTLMPQNETGIYLSGGYIRNTLERILSGLNEAPINNYNEHKYEIACGYLNVNRKNRWGVQSAVFYRKRNGKDYIIGNAAAGEFKVLEKLPMFMWEEKGGKASVIFGRETTAPFSWSIQPSVNYSENKISNLHPAKAFNDKKITSSMQLWLSWQKRKTLLSVRADAGYETHFSSSLDLPKALIKKYLLDYLAYTFEQTSANQYFWKIKPSISFMLSQKVAFNISVSYNYRHYATNNRQHAILGNVGINF